MQAPAPPSPPSEREKRGAWILTACAFLLFCIYSVATPLFEASDELWHYPMVMHLATGGALPVQRADQTDADAPWRQEGSQPPLYYAVAALVSAPFDHSNWREIRRINAHADMGVPTRDGNANAILHTPAEAFPWTRAALAARVARLVSIVMSTVTVFFAYRCAQLLFHSGPDVGARRLLSMVFVACVPMFAFISGAVNNDNAAAMFSTLGFWWALRLAYSGALTNKDALIAGLITGAGALSKSSTLGLLGLFGISVGWLWLRGALRLVPGPTLAQAARWLGIVAVTVLAISGWWFVRNLQLYGDLLGWNAFLDVVGRRDTPATLAQLWTEREGFVWAYWGVFGTVNVIMPPVVYPLLNGMGAVAFGGLLWLMLRHFLGSKKAPAAAWKTRTYWLDAFAKPMVMGWIFGLVWTLVVFVALLRWTALTPASQGRLMFPAIAPIAVLTALGLASLHRRLLRLCAALLAALAVAVPFTVIAPAYAPPQNQWQRRLTTPVDLTFGEALTLIEAQTFDTSANSEITRDSEVTLMLNWRLDKPLPRNYSIFAHLINADDVIVAQRDMHPGQGNLALGETPAPYRWTDRYTVRVPRFAATTSGLRWAVGVYDLASGERLLLQDGRDRAVFGKLSLREGDTHLQPYRYANGALLDAVALEGASVMPGGVLRVTTRWRATALRGVPVNASLQILDLAANKIAQQDVALLPETTTLGFELPVDVAAKPGVYRLLLTVYEPDATRGFPKSGVYDSAGNFRGEQLLITPIRVR